MKFQANNADGASPSLPSGLPPDLIELTSQIKTILQYVSKYPVQIQKAIELFSQNKNGLDEPKEQASPAKTSLENLNQASVGACSSEQNTAAEKEKREKPASNPNHKLTAKRNTHDTEKRGKRLYEKNKTGKSCSSKEGKKSKSWSDRPSPISATTRKKAFGSKSKSPVRTRSPVRRKSASPPIRWGSSRRADPSRPSRRVVNECHRGVKRGASRLNRQPEVWNLTRKANSASIASIRPLLSRLNIPEPDFVRGNLVSGGEEAISVVWKHGK